MREWTINPKEYRQIQVKQACSVNLLFSSIYTKFLASRHHYVTRIKNIAHDEMFFIPKKTIRKKYDHMPKGDVHKSVDDVKLKQAYLTSLLESLYGLILKILDIKNVTLQDITRRELCQHSLIVVNKLANQEKFLTQIE